MTKKAGSLGFAVVNTHIPRKFPDNQKASNARRLFMVIYWVVLTACGVQNSGSGSAVHVSNHLGSPVPTAAQVKQTATLSGLDQVTSQTPTLEMAEATPTRVVQLTASSSFTTPSPVPTQSPRLSPDDWQKWPVNPAVSLKAIAIYQQGLALGNNPNAFSKVGVCQNITNYFLGIYDDPNKFRLGVYTMLQPTIDQFKGSFSRNSLAVKGGFNVAAVLNPIYVDPTVCDKDETPLACEFRHNKPSIVIISMETWWAKRPASTYEKYLRQIVDFSIQHGALPILATKADNLEGDGSINASIARVASDYDIPLWNFWLAVQHLPYKGLTPEDPDHFHLTGLKSQNFFDDPKMMQTAWPVRNLTALQALDIVWRNVSGH